MHISHLQSSTRIRLSHRATEGTSLLTQLSALTVTHGQVLSLIALVYGFLREGRYRGIIRSKRTINERNWKERWKFKWERATDTRGQSTETRTCTAEISRLTITYLLTCRCMYTTSLITDIRTKHSLSSARARLHSSRFLR